MTEGNDMSTPPPPPPPGDPYAPTTTTPAGTPIGYGGSVETNKDARLWGMLAHLSGLIASFTGFPFLGPLIVWLVKKNEFPFVDDQGKEALNFQITMTIALIVATPTLCIGIGFILLPIIALVGIIFSIIGAMKANEGVPYRYPFAIRLVK